MKPTVGRIVHFVLKDSRGYAQHRPAIVVRNWADELNDPTNDMVQLQVFTDGTNDGPEYSSGLFWATSVHEDATGETEYSWHWPERIEA